MPISGKPEIGAALLTMRAEFYSLIATLYSLLDKSCPSDRLPCRFTAGRFRLRARLAVLVLLAGVTCAQAQQPVAVPLPTPLPSTLPRAQAYYACLMNCDTRQGVCQGTCSVSNSPSVTFATPSAGSRPDAGALAQCNLNCMTQLLTCKQACPR